MSTNEVSLLAILLVCACDATSAAELRPFRLPSASQDRYVVPVPPQMAAPEVQDTAPARAGRVKRAPASDDEPAVEPSWKNEVDKSSEEFDQLLKALDP